VLWGGDDFQRLAKMAHPGVQLLTFSPRENYVITCNLREAEKPGEPEVPRARAVVSWQHA
jgi:uncharacterized protein with WD repeat